MHQLAAQLPRQFSILSLILMIGMWHLAGAAPQPPVKEMNPKSGILKLTEVYVASSGEEVGKNPVLALVDILRDHGVKIIDPEGTTLERFKPIIELDIADFPLPPINSVHKAEIERQAYRISMEGLHVRIEGRSPEAVFYGVQTFGQLIVNGEVGYREIVDWPDLPVRMIMIDAARQNEIMDYYRRVIDFAAHYKINAILCHLTDDQTSALYEENYEPLMHAHAWRPEQIKELVAYAADRYIDLTPEIESLGHSRMFTRMPDATDYLHETDETKPDQSWMGTNMPGYTNVLCPASPRAQQYLDRMYTRAADCFPGPWLHIGFDEVDMTKCARCEAAYGEQTADQWMATALRQASSLAASKGKKVGLWGDMLLAHRAVVDDLSTTNTIIFDWHYYPGLKPDSVQFFKEKGFEVIASPALVCAPHIVMPDTHDYVNIDEFTRIARENDLLGVNTTIWCPMRYMSDILWTGMGYAAAQAWGGSNFDEDAFYRDFAHDYFGITSGDDFARVWNRLCELAQHREAFYESCWADEQSLEKARAATEEQQTAMKEAEEIVGLAKSLAQMDASVTKHTIEWRVIQQSAMILAYSRLHLSAAGAVGANPDALRALDQQCVEYTKWIEADWDRNRFADDPGKDGLYLPNQHLLYRFKEMHAFHQQLLAAEMNVNPALSQ